MLYPDRAIRRRYEKKRNELGEELEDVPHDIDVELNFYPVSAELSRLAYGQKITGEFEAILPPDTDIKEADYIIKNDSEYKVLFVMDWDIHIQTNLAKE